MEFAFYTTLAMVLYFFGELFSKLYANTRDLQAAAISFACCMGVTLLWFPALSSKNTLAITTTIWTLLYLIIGVAVGIIFFQESLSGLHIFAMGLAFISLVLLCF